MTNPNFAAQQAAQQAAQRAAQQAAQQAQQAAQQAARQAQQAHQQAVQNAHRAHQHSYRPAPSPVRGTGGTSAAGKVIGAILFVAVLGFIVWVGLQALSAMNSFPR